MNLELTKEELELIQAKRQEEEKKAEARKAQIQSDIDKRLADIAKYRDADDKQIAATLAFAKELGSRWSVQSTKRPEKVRVYDNGEVVWEESFERETATIWYGKFYVNVQEHIVYSSSWSRHGTNKGFKMYLGGPEVDYKYNSKPLSNAKTINKKVDEVIEAGIAKIEAQKKQLTAVESTIAKMKEMYPEAEVTSDKGWYQPSSYNRRAQGYAFDQVHIKLANGIKISYRVYPDGSLGRQSINFGGNGNQWDLLNQLNGLNINQQ